MTSSMLRGVRGSLVLLAAGTTLAISAPALAQSRVPAGAVVQPLPGGDGADLRRYLADLAANPRSLSSLIGAGRAAIRVGDGQAALGFFARAEEIAPNEPRVKAGMGSAFVLLGQSEPALRYFADAVRLGAPEVEIARDRGLAYDMAGDPRRAQQDYALILQRGEDPETRRRLALSLAVSGQRDAALRAIDPLLRRHDPAAFRTRAFVLALTGDAIGAVHAVDAAMPGQGQAMSPFLSRLAGLNPAQKAMAVHFGHFPRDGRPVQMAQAADTSAHPAAVALTGVGPAAAPAATTQQVAQASSRRRTALAEPVNTRIRPGRAQPQQAAQQPAQQPARQQPVQVAAAPTRQPARQQPIQVAAVPVQQPARQQPPSAQAATMPEPKPQQAPASSQPGFQSQQQVQLAAAPPLEIPPAMRQDPPSAPASTPVQQQPRAEPAPAREEPRPEPVQPAFSDIAALVQSLPTEEERRPAATPAAAATQRTTAAASPGSAARSRTAAAAPARTAPARSAAATPARTGDAGRSAAETPARSASAARTTSRTPAPPAHPSRHWVQIGTGQRAALAFTFNRIRQNAPDLFRNRTAHTAAMGQSSRLLVGPFATAAEARTFMNQLARQDIDAFVWTSPAGEEVARLPAR